MLPASTAVVLDLNMPQDGSGAGGSEVAAPEAQPRRRRTGTLAVALLLPVLLAPLLGLAYRAHRQRGANIVVMADVVTTGQALQRLEGATVVDLTMAGPGVVPGLPRASVSAGSTLVVRRWSTGHVYVRGSQDHGDATYYYRDGTLFVARKADSTAGTQHE
jgi:hypothetical protein